MNAQLSTFPAPRVMPNAAHAFGGIWRLTIRRYFSRGHWLTLAGMLALLVLFSFPMAPNRAAAARGFLPWVGAFYVCFLVPLLAFISAAGALRDDLGAGTVDYVFTRPVRRSAFVAFRFLAHVGCAQLDFLLALAALVAVGIYRDAPGLWAAVPVLLLAQGVVIIAFSAFGFLCGTLTSRYVIVGLLYGGLIEVGIGNVPTQLNRLSMVRQALSVLRPIMGDQRIGMGGPMAADPLSTPAALALLLTFSSVMLAVAAILFAMKELAGSSRET